MEGRALSRPSLEISRSTIVSRSRPIFYKSETQPSSQPRLQRVTVRFAQASHYFQY